MSYIAKTIVSHLGCIFPPRCGDLRVAGATGHAWVSFLEKEIHLFFFFFLHFMTNSLYFEQLSMGPQFQWLLRNSSKLFHHSSHHMLSSPNSWGQEPFSLHLWGEVCFHLCVSSSSSHKEARVTGLLWSKVLISKCSGCLLGRQSFQLRAAHF